MTPRPQLHGDPDPGGFRPRVLPPFGAAIAALAMYAVAHVLERADMAQLPAHVADSMRWPGVAILLLGTALTTWAAWGFVTHETPLEPGYVSTTLVVDGPFRFSRNPIYLGMCVGLVGWALFLEQPIAISVIPVFAFILYLRIIRHEERMLQERFGDEYASYRSRVRRWI